LHLPLPDRIKLPLLTPQLSSLAYTIGRLIPRLSKAEKPPGKLWVGTCHHRPRDCNGWMGHFRGQRPPQTKLIFYPQEKSKFSPKDTLNFPKKLNLHLPKKFLLKANDQCSYSANPFKNMNTEMPLSKCKESNHIIIRI